MYPYINTNKQIVGLSSQFDILKIGLTAPRPYLYDRIDLRVVSRIDSGMIDEAFELKSRGVTFKRMKQLGLEYGLLADYLQGVISKDALVKNLQFKIHQYAKRQLTWFKKEKDVEWFDITEKKFAQKVEKKVSNWYNA